LSDGSQRQVYLGPLDDRGKALKERFQQSRKDSASEIAAIEMSAKALRTAGMASLDPVEWRVIAALAAEGKGEREMRRNRRTKSRERRDQGPSIGNAPRSFLHSQSRFTPLRREHKKYVDMRGEKE
jgi:uncharacterized protein with von Willebrand factor type A (vWA) domain